MEALNENNVVLSMPMFKNNKSYVLDKVIEDLRVYWELDVMDIEGDDELATFKVGDELVALSMMPAPIPNSEFESMYSYSYLWENVENETKEHTNHVIVSILSSDIPMVEKYSLLTKVNSSNVHIAKRPANMFPQAVSGFFSRCRRQKQSRRRADHCPGEKSADKITFFICHVIPLLNLSHF